MNLQGDAEHQQDLAAGAQVPWAQPAASTQLSQGWGHHKDTDLGREGFSTVGFSQVSFKLFCDCFYCNESVWPLMSHQDFSDAF